MKTLVIKLFALALIALAAAPTAMAQTGNAMVRVVHASPDAPAVDVWVDGTKTLSNVSFFTASDYLSVPAGSHRFVITPAGADASAAVIDATATLNAGSAYTVAATGQLANIEATILNDNLAAPAAGKAHVRVIHFSPDAPAVDIKVQGGATLVPALAFPNASAYLPVDAGTYNLAVTPAGTNTVALDLSGTTLNAGTIYDVFAVGLLSGQPALMVEIDTPAPMARTMPNTGVGEMVIVLAGIALLAVTLLGSGLVLRRRAL